MQIITTLLKFERKMSNQKLLSSAYNRVAKSWPILRGAMVPLAP